MSNAMMGGELATMDSLKREFDTQAEAVTTLQSAVDRTMGSTVWTGPVADRFREQWNSEFRTALTRLREALIENAGVVQNRREAIFTATH